MNRSPRSSRGGFTLVEMLVVLAIIGILAAVLLPAIWQAVLSGREARIHQEISQLHMAIETYRQQHNDYPPDFSSVTTAADLTNVGNVVVRHLRRAFPKHQENLPLIFQDASGNLLVPDPSEALVSWLSGLSKDPRLPITSAADRDVIFPFVENRLIDHDGDGLPSYFPQDLQNSPYVYFDSRTYGLAFEAVNGVNVYPYQSVRPMPAGQTNPLAPGNQWVNPTTYQIIAAGLDDEFGADSVAALSQYKVFPDGLNFTDEDWDNMANFSEGKVFEDLVE